MKKERRKKKIIAVMAAIMILLMTVVGIWICRNKQEGMITDLRIRTADAMEHVDLSYYDEREQGQIKALINKYLQDLDACVAKSEIQELFSDFRKDLGKIVTSEDKLSAVKKGALEEIRECDLSRYDKDGKKTICVLIEKYCAKVESATSSDSIRKIVKRFKTVVAGVQTKAQKEAEEEKKKQEKMKQEEENTNKPAAKPSKSIAEKYVGRSVSQLINAIGYPSSTSYAPSCLGEGEDGVWRYSGFTVYTYKEGNKEIVQSVQ
ncbi:hypothetical protein ACPW7J_01195 [Ihubacter sp. rT4E-8]|uniref:hypothetical protein n=1 Tax=Ihubacter sp. rT4E-8 TaxID=3242369 RepID=UPI003CF74161